MQNYTLNVETYLSERVDGQLKYYEGAANKAKKTHVMIQTTIIILGILVPVVVNVPTEWGEVNVEPYIRVLITTISLALALLTGVANFRKFGDLWLTYRMTEELLKTEKFLFLTGSGKYHSASSPFAQFVQSIEEIVSSEHIKFRSIIEETARSSED